MDFAIAAYHGVKIKENENRNKYLDQRTKKYLCSMKMMVIPAVVRVLVTASKDLEKGTGTIRK